MIYDKYSFTIPDGMGIRVITDTDAKNEADDQYCIVHTLLSPRFDNVGMIAAHFGDMRGPGSMEESYEEIDKIFDLMKFEKSIIKKGADKALPDINTPVPSEGARLIIEEAMKENDKPLFVTFLGPLTDMASAYLMEPGIAERLTCIWIGGGRYPIGGREYNLNNDINAANVVFNSNIPLWQVPRNVYQQVIVSIAELESKVAPCGEIGKYLYEQLVAYGHTVWAKKPPRTGEVWCLGDSPVVGLMLWDHLQDYDWMPAPNVTEDMFYIHQLSNRPIRVYNRIDSRFILEDFFAKLKKFAGG